MAQPRDAYVGKWFHTLETNKDGFGVVVYQGRVMRRLKSGAYVVQLHEWWTGQESDTLTMPEAELLRHSRFYDTSQEMCDWYQYSYTPARIARGVA